ncbi:PTS sugar transporter subunit IIA [Tianweitania sediminis]|uniref:PTS sugar transporter subunit IIA n=1 Tax=Tianweitania sediminis TaxID=1502156 RepID=A0A8J7QZ79_9HYPH|nr:PTS sugar transporter subunit IIA [Tianweitania sediminis]MBP0438017.1 PTS sugar transporter subunit IIA [Tianweitania sediminis]
MEITDLLTADDVFMQVKAPAKRFVLRQLSCHLAEVTGLPALAVSTALLDREALGSTSIGHGIGLPHALVGDMGRPAAALAILKDPIDFGSPDSQPVDVVLAVIWPRKEAVAFNRALSSFCRILYQPDTFRSLRRAPSADEILSQLQATTVSARQCLDARAQSSFARREATR